MKKIWPFLITGLLSIGIALGFFSILTRPVVVVQPVSPKTVLTNQPPFAFTSGQSLPITGPDMIMAANVSKQAVVYIESRTVSSTGYFSRKSYSGSTGSGVVISENGYIATNHHVIEDGGEIIVLLENGHEYPAKLMGSDPSTDLALLKIEATGLPYLMFGNSDSLMVGEWVIAVGNPFKLYSTVTAGIVSAKSRNINILDQGGIESFIQTDAAVNPGNSGGALVNTRGQLVGINTAIMTYSGQYEGFSFAIPSNLAKKVLEDIRQYGSAHRGWLGVVIRPLDNTSAQDAGLNEVSGVVIEKVNENSAAEEGGLRSGDVIVNIDGKKIVSSPDFMGIIGQHRPGDLININYYREGKIRQAKIKLSDSQNGIARDIATSKAPDQILKEIGMDVRDLNENEEARLSREGVMVNSITEGSQIEGVNMEENFIITQINGVPVNNVNDFKAELQHAGSSIYLQGYYEQFQGDFAYSLDLK
ncbi:MAG: trypsin-like peptidase domain-containing protein [Saprospiraceae bacterium]|uniref:Trypsin-like peptidase domain-containing protein n=1 Tax=Candidatus Opimibacter skivensis TaxID=2982028 RepID=A0A9D7SWJ1_9BACT|nr:trypsin-like peptidase domain-containing protein [Candidatus Opimibacter skivensis]